MSDDRASETPATAELDNKRVADAYAAARPFTASAQIDPKPYGGPWLR